MSVWSHIVELIPFIGAGIVQEDEYGKTKVIIPALIAKIVELLILGSILVYASVQVNSSRLDTVTQELTAHSVECHKTQDLLLNLSNNMAQVNVRLNMIDKQLEKP